MSPGFGLATFGLAKMSLIALDSIGSLGLVEAIIRHSCLDPCLSLCFAKLIRFTLH